MPEDSGWSGSLMAISDEVEARQGVGERGGFGELGVFA